MQTKEEIAAKLKLYRKLNPDKVAMWEKTKRTRHADKIKERAKVYRNAHKDKIKDRDLRSKYGITLEQYNELLVIQNNSCAICGKHQLELDKPLCVDHDHETGKIRGLLCNECNWGLGKFNDSLELLNKTIKYLKNG